MHGDCLPVSASVCTDDAQQVFASQHFACPFGATGSVHGWERIGAGVAHIGRVFLYLALLRYVDDYFGPER